MQKSSAIVSKRNQLVFAGAAPDTGNMGVSALCYSTITELLRRLPDTDITALDFGHGQRQEQIAIGDRPFSIMRCGAMLSRRLYSSDTLWNIRLAARFGGLWNNVACRLLTASAVLDISGGDSFTDLYGEHRFRAVAYMKNLALQHGVPLILLPQTYGPFTSSRWRDEASQIVRGSRLAFARDARSFETLKDLLGDGFDPSRHRSGVDVAFLLQARQPAELPEPIRSWVEPSRSYPLFGLNVSGLIYNNPEGAKTRYEFKADYRAVVQAVLSLLLQENEARVILISHVLTPPGHYESDLEAAEHVRAALPTEAQSRVAILPTKFDQSELKWVIGRMDWFCGTRMHATIASLSSGVPTTAIAYSGKTVGVFETCGQASEVVDPRFLSTDEVVDRVWQSWNRREKLRESLVVRLPQVLGLANEQMDVIAAACVATTKERNHLQL